MKDRLETISNLFEDKEIRSIWDSEKEEYFFSVVDVISALTDSKEPRKYWSVLKNRLKKEGSEVLVICAKTEEELSKMEPDEMAMFLEELGLEESGLNRLIKKSYALLGLISYLTAGEKETRAWTIVKGTKAPQAAGKIHSDFEKGFIRAEICDWQTLLDCNGLVGAREKGKVRSEGKEYVIKDGDVVLFRFNV